MLLRQKLCIAYNHPLTVAELPSGCVGVGHSVALTLNPQISWLSAAMWARGGLAIHQWA
jgi:hypothetical protein